MVTYAGWRPDQVVFVVDGIRHPTDNPRVKSSYFMQMREFFMSEARLAGFEVVDMDELFFARLAREDLSFDFGPIDRHWNGTAHGIAADAIASSAVFTRWRQQFILSEGEHKALH
jgi:hypothetical protein